MNRDEEAFINGLFRFAPLTTLIFVINFLLQILVWRLQPLNPELALLIMGGKLGEAVLEGQVWRLLSANFLHVGWLHLLVNSITLFQLGILCENLYGKLRFSLLYLLCGMSGFLLSSLLSHAMSAGASASLAGLMGALLSFGWTHEHIIPPAFRRHFTWYLLPWVIITIAFGIFYSGIDNYAHLGGLFCGLILGVLLKPRLSASSSRPVVLGLMSFALLLFVLWSFWTAAFRIPKELELATQGAKERNPEGELELLSRYLDELPNSGLLHFLRGEARVGLLRAEAAEEDYRAALAMNYDELIVKNGLAWAICLQSDPSRSRLEEALKMAREVVRKDREPSFLNTLGWVYYQKGDYAAARSLLQEASDKTGSSHDLFLYMLAMAQYQLNEMGSARKSYDEAVLMSEESEAESPEVTFFRQQAAALLSPILP